MNVWREILFLTAQKSFPSRFFSVNVTKAAGQFFCTLFLKQSKTIEIHQDYIYNNKMTVKTRRL